MATATKKAPAKAGAKKAPAAKATAAKAETKKQEGPTASELRAQNDERLTPLILAARDEDEKKWGELASELGISDGKAMLLYYKAKVTPKTRIKASDETELAAKIVAARDEDEDSWGMIAARADIPESRVRKLYSDATGNTTKGLRIGKGGRWPEGSEGAAAAASKGSETKGKSSAKKAPAKGSGSKWDGMDEEAIAEALTGKNVTYKVKGKSHKIKVEEIDDITGVGPDAEITVGEDVFVLRTVVSVRS